MTGDKCIHFMIDDIDKIKGPRPNLLGINRHCMHIESIFSNYKVKYVPSYYADKVPYKWFYPVVIYQFFMTSFTQGGSGHPIHAHLPKAVKAGVDKGQGKLLFIVVEAMQLEAVTYIESFILRHKVMSADQENFIFITPHILNHPHFYTTDLNPQATIYNEEHDIVLSENREYKKGISFYDNTSTLTKRKFCCFLSNYHERYIRGLTACALEKTKLLDQGFVSLKNYGQDFKETLDTSLLTSKHLKAVSTLVNEEFTELEFTATDKVFDMLNMEEILHKSLFNFVIEGSYDKPVKRIYSDVAGAVLHITEKTYRNFIYKKPFIVLGQVGQLKFIRKLGYKTFSPIIDESYDDCTDSSKRFYMVMEQMKQLCSKSIEELEKIIIELDDILEHNYKVYYDNKNKLQKTLVDKLNE